MIYRPADFGAVGDGVADDGPALAAMVAAVMQVPKRADVDLSGTWHVGDTFTLQTPPESTVRAGVFVALDGASIDGAIVELDLGGETRISGTLRAHGFTTSHLKNRNAGTGVLLVGANQCHIDGLAAKWTRRDGVAVQQGGNVIGCSIGRIDARMTGAAGHKAAVHYTRGIGAATRIERQGGANSKNQRATVYCDPTALHWLEPGDQLLIGGRPYPDGGNVVDVVSIEADHLVVYPWPSVDGDVTLPIESLHGAGFRTVGGNTTGMHVGAIMVEYAGLGLASQGLYGISVGALTVEVAGAAYAAASRNGSHQGDALAAFHPELASLDVLVLDFSCKRCVIQSGVVYRPWMWRVLAPTLDGGMPGSAAWTVCVVQQSEA